MLLFLFSCQSTDPHSSPLGGGNAHFSWLPTANKPQKKKKKKKKKKFYTCHFSPENVHTPDTENLHQPAACCRCGGDFWAAGNNNLKL